MKRAIVLSLVVLLSVGIILPLTVNWSEASKPSASKKRKKVKKYSRAWWRIYRAKVRRNRALAARKRALIARRNNAANNPQMVKAVQKSSTVMDAPVAGWSGESVTNGEAKYRVADSSGRSIGSANLAVVGAAMPTNEAEMPARMRDKMLAGVPVSSLRRTVIDKMIREQGWIVNDYQREVNGKKVFVVVAQTPGGGAVNSRLFYFTEVDGRIYSLSTNTPNDYSDKVAADSEQFIQKLQRGNRSEAVTASTGLR